MPYASMLPIPKSVKDLLDKYSINNPRDLWKREARQSPSFDFLYE